ncbi:MAG: hypothetical protein IPK80_02415 [Nannocystis sp.]|nr:hypothetical protein [Nannocystis sp.]
MTKAKTWFAFQSLSKTTAPSALRFMRKQLSRWSISWKGGNYGFIFSSENNFLRRLAKAGRHLSNFVGVEKELKTFDAEVSRKHEKLAQYRFGTIGRGDSGKPQFVSVSRELTPILISFRMVSKKNITTPKSKSGSTTLPLGKLTAKESLVAKMKNLKIILLMLAAIAALHLTACAKTNRQPDLVFGGDTNQFRQTEKRAFNGEAAIENSFVFISNVLHAFYDPDATGAMKRKNIQTGATQTVLPNGARFSYVMENEGELLNFVTIEGDIYRSRSTDGGLTWVDQIKVVEAERVQWNPALRATL